MGRLKDRSLNTATDGRVFTLHHFRPDYSQFIKKPSTWIQARLLSSLWTLHFHPDSAFPTWYRYFQAYFVSKLTVIETSPIKGIEIQGRRFEVAFGVAIQYKSPKSLFLWCWGVTWHISFVWIQFFGHRNHRAPVVSNFFFWKLKFGLLRKKSI